MTNNKTINGTITWANIRGVVFVGTLVVTLTFAWANLSNRQDALCNDIERVEREGSAVARQNQIIITEMKSDLRYIIQKQEETTVGQKEILKKIEEIGH